MPRILTGDHSLPGNAVSMRRFGPLSNGNRFSGRVMMAICRAPRRTGGTLPSVLLRFQTRKKLNAGFWSARIRPTGQQKNLNLLKHFRSMLRSADVTTGNGVLNSGCSGSRCLAEQPPISCKSFPGSKNDNIKCDGASGTGQVVTKFAYLRAAQAYMLISIPTGTSTIFGVFQAIRELPSRRHDYRAKVV